jgi:hypothetical protein
MVVTVIAKTGTANAPKAMPSTSRPSNHNRQGCFSLELSFVIIQPPLGCSPQVFHFIFLFFLRGVHEVFCMRYDPFGWVVAHLCGLLPDYMRGRSIDNGRRITSAVACALNKKNMRNARISLPGSVSGLPRDQEKIARTSCERYLPLSTKCPHY